MSRRDRQILCALLCVGAILLGGLCAKLVMGQERARGPLGIPPNALDAELGRRLFFDPILSSDQTISCASCHNPNKGWSDGLPVAAGIRGQLGTRNTPTLINVGDIKPMMFWDGRSVETSDQSILPIQNPIEMGNQTIEAVAGRLNRDDRYVRAFLEVFGSFERGQAVTPQRIARCLASFEASINSRHAPIDAYLAGDENALTAMEKRGFELCKSGGCFTCHPAPLFTDGLCHNVGTEYASRGRIVDEGRAKVTRGTRAPNGASLFRQADIGAFKTPTLRSVNRTAPYMHNGRYPDLISVVRHLNTGGYFKVQGKKGEFHDPNIEIKPLGWSAEDEKIVAEFLVTAFDGADYPLIGAP